MLGTSGGSLLLEASVRIATTDNGQTNWLDLCDPQWRAVKITAQGWSIETQVPVRFVRYPSSESLPEPEPGGSLNELKTFASVVPDDWPLVAAWLVGCFLPKGTYPVLQISGRHGSGKSTMQDACVNSLTHARLNHLWDCQRTKSS